ncbi:MAG TPA: D-serine ammonia-lyase, partial [Synergistaceae bacterium]|nr:D-serine ammonia-lyase [Synergistaceae bacterium]
MMNPVISGRTLEEWKERIPCLEKVVAREECFWWNPDCRSFDSEGKKMPFPRENVSDAEVRLQRFAPLLERLFPELEKTRGIIESPLREIPRMAYRGESFFGKKLEGRFFLKMDSHLPVSGSIKARGGIYEVLKHAEDLAFRENVLAPGESYALLAEPRARSVFSRHSLAVGSTGNLGLSIGIMGAALGFQVFVHMSADAKAWKKDLLRSRGAHVIEYDSDYGKAVEEGRKQALQDPAMHFVDDESSEDLFLGYATAAERLAKQLKEQNIRVDPEHPLFVYLPCGVGGAPGGITFGLKLLFGDAVHCFFAEPTHAPCVLLGILTGLRSRVGVEDFGLDNRT